jgi:hypothetical protein
LIPKNCTTEKPTKKAVTGFPWVQIDSKKLHNRKAHKKGSDSFPTGFLAKIQIKMNYYVCY